MSQVQYFLTSDEAKLNWYSWTSKTPSRACNIYIHNSFTHCMEGSYLAEELANNGIITYAFNLRGWNMENSEYPEFSGWERDIEDIANFIQFVQTLHPDLPLILSGHGTGALQSLLYLSTNQNIIKIALISSPWISMKISFPGSLKLSKTIFPNKSFEAPFTLEILTHDNDILETYYQDKEKGFRNHNFTAKWYGDLQKQQDLIKETAANITTPVIMLHGGQDLIIDDTESQKVFDQLQSNPKKWEYYPRFYHDVWNEDKREESHNHCIQFINSILN
ncbi:MAG: lysophospholipase [Candidatus Heimdallarchaeota archaeon]|nr:lysophospholipase [Candidatus Heimdallarchaeota archaeon]MDH5646288.1 lysophospholipase [Candidatus Heimdallarchaeota archaeon]